MSRLKRSLWAVLTIGALITSAFYPIRSGVAGQRQAATAASLNLAPSSSPPGAVILLRGAGFSLPGPASVNWDSPNGPRLGLGQPGYTGDKNHPLLPVIDIAQLLPETGGVITPTLNLGQSRFITLNNDIPLPTVGTFDGNQVIIDPGFFREQGFFPATGIYTDTRPVAGGGGIGLGLNIIPVQYDKDLHQTRICTRLVFDLETRANAGAGGEDTDGDELPDYWETSFGLDPDDPTGDHGAQGDPDQDGLANLDEFQRGTNPLNPDTDQDGVSDGLEVARGSDPLDPGSPRWVYLPLILKN